MTPVLQTAVEVLMAQMMLALLDLPDSLKGSVKSKPEVQFFDSYSLLEYCITPPAQASAVGASPASLLANVPGMVMRTFDCVWDQSDGPGY